MFWRSEPVTCGFIINVISGDTFEFLDAVTRKVSLIRLDNVMAPVKGQKYFRESRDFVKKILIKNGKSLMVRVTVKRDEKDGYYVDLRYPLKSNDDYNSNYKLLQATLVSNGLAFVVNEEQDIVLTGLQVKAMESKRNVWSMKKITKPWRYKNIGKEIKELRLLNG